MITQPQIAILMCTYNGALFLQEQLDSFAAQTHKNWSLWVSDDGSSDETLEILECFAKSHDVHIFEGPKQGFCANFLSLMCREIDADYFALSDQDDIWLPQKLERAVGVMMHSGISLYGGRTITADQDGKQIGISPLFEKKPCFENALVQSIMGGNTMVVERTAIGFVKKVGVVDVVSHDWWVYLLMTASGVKVYYDKIPMLLYRQTGQNLIGSNHGLRAKFNRLKRVFASEFKDWNGRNLHQLQNPNVKLTPEAQIVFAKFNKVRNHFGVRSIRFLRSSGVFRQPRREQLALYLAAFFKKL